MKIRKLKVAVTGSIGSGKSAFCRFLAEKGYPVINADEESKKILAENKNVKEKVIREFGSESFLNNKINKKYLAEKIFPYPENVIKINSILHPEVKLKINSLTEESFRNHNVVFTEAALIYEADMEEMFDYVVLVTADKNVRMQRKIAQKEFTGEEFERRNNNQIPDEEKGKKADFIFLNNGAEAELKEKAELLITLLKGLS
jgi:dephospho-CoA kinase